MDPGFLGSLLSGIFGNSGGPYDEAMEQYKKYNQEARDVHNPFYKSGQEGLQNYQDWGKSMQNPGNFINNLMGGYQESPWAHYQQQQGTRAAQNLGSASGLTGSTPLMQQAQQNSQNISSQDMGNWLQNVLGINTQYGASQNNLMQGGQNAANALSNLSTGMGKNMGDSAFGSEAGRQNDLWKIIAGGLGLLL